MSKKKWSRRVRNKRLSETPASPSPDQATPPELSSGFSPYLTQLVQEMSNNHARMQLIFQQSKSMSDSVDWKNIQSKSLKSSDSTSTFHNMLGHMVDVYTGIMTSCSTFSTCCALALDLILLNIESPSTPSTPLPTVDNTSLDWILQSANLLQQSESPPQDEHYLKLVKIQEDLEGYAEGFAKISAKANEELKGVIVKLVS
jgi:hypothetical protein